MVSIAILIFRGRRVRDHMVVGFTTTYATSTYHNSGDTTLCEKVGESLATGHRRWFSPGTPVSSTNKRDRYITEILLKVALSTINQPTSHQY